MNKTTLKQLEKLMKQAGRKSNPTRSLVGKKTWSNGCMVIGFEEYELSELTKLANYYDSKAHDKIDSFLELPSTKLYDFAKTDLKLYHKEQKLNVVLYYNKEHDTFKGVNEEYTKCFDESCEIKSDLGYGGLYYLENLTVAGMILPIRCKQLEKLSYNKQF